MPSIACSEEAPPRRKSIGAAKLFSFPVMCMVLLAAAIVANTPRGIGIVEPDIWWHLLNAQNLLQHHSLSRVDTYTFTVAGSPWISFEWLSEIPFFLAFRAAGLQGIVVLYSFIMVLIFVGVYYRSCRAGADCKDAAVATMGGICLASAMLAPRTLLFGWLCLTGVLLVLDHFRRTGNGLWLLPPLFALWINLHGSWVYGIIVIVLTIASGLLEGEWGLVGANRWRPAELKKLLLALAASLAALFANPFGYKLVLYPLDFVVRLRTALQVATYWLPVDFSTQIGKFALGLIFVVLAVVLFSRRRWRLDEVLLTAFALWSGLMHEKLLDFTAIIVVPILAPHLKLFPPYQQKLDKPWLNAAIIAAVVASVILLFPSGVSLQRQIDREYPRAALDFMRRDHLNGQIFNQTEWGGYMEWTTPEFKPFIDGRTDIFVYKGVFDDYLNALWIRQPANVFDKYRIDYVLLQPEQPLVHLLERSPGWRLIYSDQVAVLFERTPTAAATHYHLEPGAPTYQHPTNPDPDRP